MPEVWYDADPLHSNWLADVGYDELMGVAQSFTFRKPKQPFRSSNGGAEAPRRQTRFTDEDAKRLYRFRDTSWCLDRAEFADDMVYLFERVILRAGTDGWVACQRFSTPEDARAAWGEILAISEELEREEAELLAVPY